MYKFARVCKFIRLINDSRKKGGGEEGGGEKKNIQGRKTESSNKE